jgi:NAD/NADP transhydrogenase beta subunit
MTGLAGLDDQLFQEGKAMTVFGDAKKVVDEKVEAVE